MQGSRFIKKAEKSIEAGNYSRSEKLLAKALKANYGFCGNAWVTAHDRIYMSRTKIQIGRGQYDAAMATLDSVNGCGFGTDCTKRELIRIEILIKKFGKEKVREAFANATTKIINDDIHNIRYVVELPTLDYSFSFSFRYEYRKVDGERIRLEPDMEQVLKQQPFYALLE